MTASYVASGHMGPETEVDKDLSASLPMAQWLLHLGSQEVCNASLWFEKMLESSNNDANTSK